MKTSMDEIFWLVFAVTGLEDTFVLHIPVFEKCFTTLMLMHSSMLFPCI